MSDMMVDGGDHERRCFEADFHETCECERPIAPGDMVYYNDYDELLHKDCL